MSPLQEERGFLRANSKSNLLCRLRLLLCPLLSRRRPSRASPLRCLLALQIRSASLAFGSYTVLLSHSILYRLKLEKRNPIDTPSTPERKILIASAHDSL